jgi:type III polyketide synthase
MALGLPLTTDRTLLHGVGCAGGLSLVRLAHQLARVPVDSSSSKPNRILIISAEVTSTLCRSESDELNKASKATGGDPGWPNVSLCLFSDGASAMVVGSADSRGLLQSNGECLKAKNMVETNLRMLDGHQSTLLSRS